MADAATERFSLLAAASGALGESLDADATLTRLAELLAGGFCDGAVVDVADADGAIRRVAVRVSDPAKRDDAQRLLALGPPNPDAPMGIQRLLRASRPVFAPVMTDDGLAAGARDAEHLAVLRRLAPRSGIVLPLAARGRAVGVLWLFRFEGRAPFDDGDLALAEQLAARAALAADNGWLYRQAQEAIAARDHFLTVASHELKTPLTALTLRVQALERAGGGAEARAVGAQVERLRRLVERILDVSRLGDARPSLAPVPLDLAALARDAVASMLPEAERAGVALSVDAPAPVRGRWDPLRLEQVVVNLVGNALKYGLRNPVEVRVEDRGATARLSVRDRGIGIAAWDRERIFQRFERAVSPRYYAGLGIGLWIARQIVEASGGAITVESEPGEGSTFLVELPRAPSPGPGDAEEPPAAGRSSAQSPGPGDAEEPPAAGRSSAQSPGPGDAEEPPAAGRALAQ